MDIRILEMGEDEWHLRVPGKAVQRVDTREGAKRAAFRCCRLAARSGRIVHVTVVETTPGPEFDQGRTGLLYERADDASRRPPGRRQTGPRAPRDPG